MNNDNLSRYLKNEQVYSNDLNVILARTPSRIFYFMLWAILAIVVIVTLCFYLITYQDKVTIQGFIKKKGDAYVVSFIGDRELANKVSSQKGLSISLPNPRFAGPATSEFMAEPTSVTIKQVYFKDGREFETLSDSMLHQPIMPVLKYRIEFTVASGGMAKYISNSQNHLTELTIRLSRKKLYKKFI